MCKEGTCKCKEICAKMQEAGLRESIATISNFSVDTEAKHAIRRLQNMQNILCSYECLPARCLVPRLKWMCSMIAECSKCYLEDYLDDVLSLAKEVEAFLDSKNA